jgi:NAD(P)-dependent dehydrogenase (short-subunit alcohol dehydrogenase family)
VAADISREEDVQRLIATIRNEMPSLRGIVHAAGEGSLTPLRTLTADEIDRVFSGKVRGAWWLSRAAVGHELDFFISFSSIASVWGSFGQAAYAAANAFLDGLASAHRSSGLAGTSVNFGPWTNGMANIEARDQLARRGVLALSAETALAGMTAIVSTPVLTASWRESTGQNFYLFTSFTQNGL